MKDREQLRKELNREKARAALRKEEADRGTPGDPCKYFIRIGDVPDGTVAVLVSRVSHRNQKEHLKDQERELLQAASKAGVEIVAKVRHVGKANDPTWTKKIGKVAKKFKATHVMATEPNRIIRHEKAHVNRDNYDWEPTEEHYQNLRRCIGNHVTLVTLISPDAPWEEVASRQKKRGQLARNNKGGRPKIKVKGYKKKLCREYEQEAIEMRIRGCSLRQIAFHVSTESGYKVNHATIRNWVNAVSVP